MTTTTTDPDTCDVPWCDGRDHSGSAVLPDDVIHAAGCESVWGSEDFGGQSVQGSVDTTMVTVNDHVLVPRQVCLVIGDTTLWFSPDQADHLVDVLRRKTSAIRAGR